MVYEWSRRKARVNLGKHGVSYEEAATVFLDPLAMTYADPDHSADEEREITIGHSIRQRLLIVSHCQRAERCRIIIAQEATRQERRQHEEGNSEDRR